MFYNNLWRSIGELLPSLLKITIISWGFFYQTILLYSCHFLGIINYRTPWINVDFWEFFSIYFCVNNRKHSIVGESLRSFAKTRTIFFNWRILSHSYHVINYYIGSRVYILMYSGVCFFFTVVFLRRNVYIRYLAGRFPNQILNDN